MCEQGERGCWAGANTEEMQHLGSVPQPHQVTACCKRMASGETVAISGINLGDTHSLGAGGLPVWRQAEGSETAIYSSNVFPLSDWQTRD